MRFCACKLTTMSYRSNAAIAELAARKARVVGYPGLINFDASKPAGALRKLMDSGRLNALGWKAWVGFEDGLANACLDMNS